MPKMLLAVVGAAVIAAFAFPSVFQRYQQSLAEQAAREEIDRAPPVVEAAMSLATPGHAGRVAALRAESDGHFRTEARLNGRPIPVLVDTGATYVSLSEADARRLGIVVRPADFRYKAQTANGETSVAMTVLDRVAIGRVEVRNVEAIVSKGEGLSVTLLGMSFLGKLKRFGVEGDRLDLVQ